jgi:hypothetical protein
MNLNQLWSGNDYAYYEGRGRNESFRNSAQRVKILRAFKKQLPGNERESGFALVQFLDDEGELITNWRYPEGTGEVKARDIVMRWDEYANEREQHAVEAAERARIAEQERQERMRQHELAQQRVNERKEHILEGLEKRGIPREWVTINTYGIILDRSLVESGLGLHAEHQ